MALHVLWTWCERNAGVCWCNCVSCSCWDPRIHFYIVINVCTAILFFGPFYNPIFRPMIEKDMNFCCLVDIETCLYLCDVCLTWKSSFFFHLKFNPFPKLFDHSLDTEESILFLCVRVCVHVCCFGCFCSNLISGVSREYFFQRTIFFSLSSHSM